MYLGLKKSIVSTMKQLKAKQGVCHIVALPFTLRKYFKAKKKFMETQILSPCKNIIFKKNSSKRNQNPSRYYNSITHLKFQHKPKYHL